jgi:hypothetical protein
LAASAVVIAVNLLHQHGGVLPRAAGPRPRVSASPSSSVPAVVLPGPQHSAQAAPGGTLPVVAATGGASRSSSGLTRGGATPSPSPSRPVPPVAVVNAGLVVPIRGAPASVRVVVAIPGAPPIPPLGLPLLP